MKKVINCKNCEDCEVCMKKETLFKNPTNINKEIVDEIVNCINFEKKTKYTASTLQ